MGLIKLPKKFHPDFSQLNKKPIAPVKIDWDNTLARGLQTCVIFNDNGKDILDLVPYKPYLDVAGDIDGVGYSRASNAHGKYVIANRVANRKLLLHPDRAVDSGEGVTILMGVTYNSGTVDHTLVHIGTALGINSPLIWADTLAGQLRPNFNSSGTLNGDAGAIPVDEFTIWGASFTTTSPTNVQMYVDGVVRGSGVSGATDNITARPWNYCNDGTVDNRGTSGEVQFIVVWDRVLTQAEHLEFSRDPYQILKPATPVTYFTSSAAGVQDLAPTGIASLEVFGIGAVTTGSVDLTPTGIVSSEVVGTATLIQEQFITATGIGSTEAFGSHTVTLTQDVSPNGIASTEAFGTAVLTTGAVIVTPNGVASEEVFGTAVVSQATFITPNGIASAEVFGTSVITTGAVVLTPAGISSAEAFGSHVVAVVGAKDIKIDFQDEIIIDTNLQSKTLYFNGSDYFSID